MNWSNFWVDKSVDFFITSLSIVVGGYLALYIAKYQLNQEANQEKEKNDEIAKTLINRCRIELRDNRLTLLQLRDILDKSQRPHVEHYEWILALTESFKRAAYDDLLRLNLNHHFPKRLEGHLSSSFELLDGLHYMVKVAFAGFKFHDKYGGSDDINLPLKNIKTYANTTVIKHIESSLEAIDKYTNKKV